MTCRGRPVARADLHDRDGGGVGGEDRVAALDGLVEVREQRGLDRPGSRSPPRSPGRRSARSPRSVVTRQPAERGVALAAGELALLSRPRSSGACDPRAAGRRGVVVDLADERRPARRGRRPRRCRSPSGRAADDARLRLMSLTHRCPSRQTLRRYWPPTSKNASVICCRLHTRAASIKTANTLPPDRAVSLSAARAAWASSRCRVLEVADPVQLGLLLLLGAAGERDRRRLRRPACGLRKVLTPMIGSDAVVLAPLVQHRLVLDLAALVAGLHRAEHPAAVADPLELGQHRLLHQVGELIDDERALQRVLVHRQPPLPADDQLDRQRAAHRLLGRRGDGLVVGVGVQAAARCRRSRTAPAAWCGCR